MAARELDEDRGLDMRLRPGSLQEFVGQRRLKEHLGIYIEAAPLISRSTSLLGQ